MFHKTSTKLAAFYLAIIMTISLFFSVVVYQLSVQELDRGLRRPGMGLERHPELGLGPMVRAQLQEERELVFEQAKMRVLSGLVAINIFIALGGGFVSYYLARRTLRPIEETHAALERFTADASHELRTPLAAMRAEIEVALMNPKLNLATTKHVLESNLEEVDRLTRLSEGLLQLARLQDESLQVEKARVATIARKAIEQIASQADLKKIKIDVQIPKDLDVQGDRGLLTEVIAILADNAVKYSPEGSTVVVSAEEYGHPVRINVTDQGPGIPEMDLNRIFDRFYRANGARSKQQVGGYGLGLAIAKNIVERHGGHIAVMSVVGSGTTFTVTLP